jgi:hypothetical protein
LSIGKGALRARVAPGPPSAVLWRSTYVFAKHGKNQPTQRKAAKKDLIRNGKRTIAGKTNRITNSDIINRLINNNNRIPSLQIPRRGTHKSLHSQAIDKTLQNDVLMRLIKTNSNIRISFSFIGLVQRSPLFPWKIPSGSPCLASLRCLFMKLWVFTALLSV